MTDHLLAEARYRPSPNRSGALVGPRFVVIHYTAGASAEGAVAWLTNPDAPGKPSAHLVIGRDGALWQLVPFDRVAHHAGRSRWAGLSGLNRHSIGIELVNPGPLTARSDGGFADAHGRLIPAAGIVRAAHRHGGPRRPWQAYPTAQLDTLERALRALRHRYPTLEDVVGHDDIAPGRKIDPGPAFPMDRFKALFRRADFVSDVKDNAG